MADIDEKTPLNVPGKFYVDSSCIDCDLCRETAPENFGRDDDEGQAYQSETGFFGHARVNAGGRETVMF